MLGVEARRDAERVLAADRDERVEPTVARSSASTRSTPPSSLKGFVRLVPMIVPPRGRIPDTCCGAEVLEDRLDETAPALADGDDVPAGRVRPADDGANDRVQPGAVAAAGEDADALRHSARA